MGCKGGWYYNTWEYIFEAGGVASSTDYPYNSMNGTAVTLQPNYIDSSIFIIYFRIIALWKLSASRPMSWVSQLWWKTKRLSNRPWPPTVPLLSPFTWTKNSITTRKFHDEIKKNVMKIFVFCLVREYTKMTPVRPTVPDITQSLWSVMERIRKPDLTGLLVILGAQSGACKATFWWRVTSTNAD